MKKARHILMFCASLFIVCGAVFAAPAASSDPSLPRLAKMPQNTLVFLRHQPVQYRVRSGFEKHLAHDYLKHYFFVWSNPLAYIAPLDLRHIEDSVVQKFEMQPGWNENKRRHLKAWVVQIARNMDLKNLPNHKADAITVNQTNLRTLPTDVPLFGSSKKAGEGHPFDHLQVSMLKANVPVYVVQTSKDGAWVFVITPGGSFGWVSIKNVAYVNAQFIKRWRRKQDNYVTPILDGRPIRGKNKAYYFSTRIGGLYPLIKRNKQYDIILVAARDLNGNAAIREAKISRKIVRPWPIPATSENIARLANRFLGIPYGWGDIYGYRDCSETIRDLFAPFAIWLPRNSSQQTNTGSRHSLVGKDSSTKKHLLLKKGIPFFTLLWKSGHVLLYIGAWNSNAIVFHSPWGIHTKSFLFHKPGRIIIGRTVITPLNLGKGHFDVPKTWLDGIQSFTYLVSPEQLKKSEGTHQGLPPFPSGKSFLETKLFFLR